jgi:hypothetical protein
MGGASDEEGSEVKDSVVINDRWAKFKNGKHGDFYTSEYSSSNKKYDKPWEECRGMGFSFGYNKLEDIEFCPSVIDNNTIFYFGGRI